MQKRTIRFILMTTVVGFVTLTAIKALAIDAPVMTAEPKYTAGATNTVAFTLPAEAVEVEVWQDSDSDPSNSGLQSWTSQDVPLPTQATFGGSADTLYYYYMRCRDSSGNWSGWSNIVSSTQHSDGPVFGKPYPAPESWSNMFVIRDPGIAAPISVPVSDSIGIDPESVKMTIDGRPVDGVWCPAHQAIEYTPSTGNYPADGLHTVWVSVRDLASASAGETPHQGNESTLSWTIKTDTTYPGPPSALTVPVLATSRTPTFEWSGAFDAESGIAGYWVYMDFYGSDPPTTFRYYLEANGDGLTLSTVPDDLLPLSDGVYKVRVYSCDRAGNMGNASTPVTMTMDVAGPDQPGQLSGPSGQCWTDTTPEFTWSGAKDFSGIAGYQVVIRCLSDGATRTYDLSDAPDPLVWSVPEVLTDGRYVLQVWGIDKVGHKSLQPGELSFVIDTIPPTTPVVTLPRATSFPPAFSDAFTSTDELSGVDHFHVEVRRDGVLIKSYSTDSEQLTEDEVREEGAYEYRAWAVDAAGLISAGYGTGSVCYDATAPPAPSVSVSDSGDPTPTFVISCGPDLGSGLTRCEIEWMGNRYGVDYLGGTFTWTVPDDKPVYCPGVQSIRATAVDAAGNRSSVVLYEYDFTNAFPDAPLVLEPVATNSRTPTIRWAAAFDRDQNGEHPATEYIVELWKDGTCIVTPVKVGSTSWTVPAGVISAEGEYQAKVWTVDDTGLNSESFGYRYFEFDVTPPPNPISVSGPSLTNSAGLKLSVVQPAGFEEPLRCRVEVWQSGVCTWQGGPEGNKALEAWAQLTEGENEIRVYAVDAAGNSSAGYVSTIVQADLTAPQNVGTIEGSVLTNDPHPVFKWDEVSDSGSGVSRYDVELWKASPGSPPSVFRSTAPATPGQVTWAVPQNMQLDGTGYQLLVWAVDCAGNRSRVSAVLDFTVDTLRPAAPPKVEGPVYANTGTPTFTCSAPSDIDFGGYSVEVHKQSGELVQSFQTTESRWAIPAALTQEGQYEVRVWSVDLTGNKSATYVSASFVLDTTAPNPPPTVEGPAYSNIGGPFVSTGAVDNGSGIGGYHIEVHKQSGELVQSFQASGVLWGIPAPLDQDGTYEVRVWADDRAGNRSKTYASLSFTLDTIAPVMAGPVQGPAATNNRCPTFSWPEASDNASGLDHYAVTITFNETSIHNLAVPAGNGSVTWTLPQENTLLADGWYTITVEAVDRAGNVSQSESLTFRLATVGPIVTILTPASGGTYSINESSSLWARANGDFVSAQVRVDGGEWTDVTKIMADWSMFHFFAVPLSPGVHTIELKVRDSVGNETIVSTTITVSGYRSGFGFGRFSFPGSGQ